MTFNKTGSFFFWCKSDFWPLRMFPKLADRVPLICMHKFTSIRGHVTVNCEWASWQCWINGIFSITVWGMHMSAWAVRSSFCVSMIKIKQNVNMIAGKNWNETTCNLRNHNNKSKIISALIHLSCSWFAELISNINKLDPESRRIIVSFLSINANLNEMNSKPVVLPPLKKDKEKEKKKPWARK